MANIRYRIAAFNLRVTDAVTNHNVLLSKSLYGDRPHFSRKVFGEKLVCTLETQPVASLRHLLVFLRGTFGFGRSRFGFFLRNLGRLFLLFLGRRRCIAVFVPAAPLQLKGRKRKFLFQLPSASRANGQRRIGNLLDDFVIFAALLALILVNGHGGKIAALHPKSSSLTLVALSSMPPTQC